MKWAELIKLVYPFADAAQFLIGSPIVPLVASVGINNKVRMHSSHIHETDANHCPGDFPREVGNLAFPELDGRV
jgi:hypothetical protein